MDAFPEDPLETLDTDNDGIGDNEDGDDDDDDVSDSSDAFPKDPKESKDTDSDGTGNNADTDDDDDGWSDEIEELAGSDPLDAQSEPADSDGDGIADFMDLGEAEGEETIPIWAYIAIVAAVIGWILAVLMLLRKKEPGLPDKAEAAAVEGEAEPEEISAEAAGAFMFEEEAGEEVVEFECPSCGATLAETETVCPKCGAEFAEEGEEEEEEEEEIECPDCGAVLTGTESVCPSCGAEFEGVEEEEE